MSGDDKLFSQESDLSTADLVDPRRETEPAGTTETVWPASTEGAAVPGTASRPAPMAEAEGGEPLFPSNEAEQMRSRWTDIQAGFVDEPRKAVEDADGLVAAAIKRMAETFAEERSRMEAQWDRGDEVSTEDLRVALQKYRTFFGRLLKA